MSEDTVDVRADPRYPDTLDVRADPRYHQLPAGLRYGLQRIQSREQPEPHCLFPLWFYFDRVDWIRTSQHNIHDYLSVYPDLIALALLNNRYLVNFRVDVFLLRSAEQVHHIVHFISKNKALRGLDVRGQERDDVPCKTNLIQAAARNGRIAGGTLAVTICRDHCRALCSLFDSNRVASWILHCSGNDNISLEEKRGFISQLIMKRQGVRLVIGENLSEFATMAAHALSSVDHNAPQRRLPLAFCFNAKILKRHELFVRPLMHCCGSALKRLDLDDYREGLQHVIEINLTFANNVHFHLKVKESYGELSGMLEDYLADSLQLLYAVTKVATISLTGFFICGGRYLEHILKGVAVMSQLPSLKILHLQKNFEIETWELLCTAILASSSCKIKEMHFLYCRLGEQPLHMHLASHGLHWDEKSNNKGWLILFRALRTNENLAQLKIIDSTQLEIARKVEQKLEFFTKRNEMKRAGLYATGHTTERLLDVIACNRNLTEGLSLVYELLLNQPSWIRQAVGITQVQRNGLASGKYKRKSLLIDRIRQAVAIAQVRRNGLESGKYKRPC